MADDLPGRVQGRDSIEIDLPVECVWPLIADTWLLPNWGLRS